MEAWIFAITVQFGSVYLSVLFDLVLLNDVLAANTDFVTYAQAPSTPGLFEEPNLFAVQEPMACSDHLDFEDHNLSNLASMGGSENAGRMSGMSAELIYLHTGTFDTSTTRVSENEQNNVSAVPLKDVESSLEPNFTKEIEPLRSTEPVIMRDDSAAQPAGVPIEKENQKEEDHNLRFHHTVAQEQGITDLEEFNTSKHEPLGEIAEMEIDKENFEVADLIVEDIYKVSADVNVRSRLMDKTDDEDALLQMDALCRSPNNKLDAQPIEVDALIVVDRNVEIRACRALKILVFWRTVDGLPAPDILISALFSRQRDYIHVEQAKPFDNVSIRSRVKLMKSDF
ncbi:uncharacterized protein [Pyrus communis]|uniref:uncharacterized protein n=1 Tax=Pyrus communis TaxID=23211 RepID=UPI0035C2590D